MAKEGSSEMVFFFPGVLRSHRDGAPHFVHLLVKKRKKTSISFWVSGTTKKLRTDLLLVLVVDLVRVPHPDPPHP